jgi:hypothetical protein
MRHTMLLVMLCCLCALPAFATTYFMSPTGRDSSNGTSSSTPWLTPKHNINCGDTILAAAGAYSYASFAGANWGTIGCSAGNNVAWVQCVTFDACTIAITTSSEDGMNISTPYWGVQGFEVDGTAGSGPCFHAASYTGSTIHHIIFANNVASGCGLNGIDASEESTTASVDYFAVVGNITYNAVGGSIYCGSGISVYEPINYDTQPGTHIYIAGNFSWGNINGNPCNGGLPSDGEGIILDTFDGSQTGTPVYTGQAAVDNNILLGNGGPGLELFNNGGVGSTWSHIYMRHNTAWGNNAGPNQSVPACAVGEIISYYSAKNVEAYDNIAATNAVDGAVSQPIYSFSVCQVDGSNHVYQDVGYSVGGTVDGMSSSTGFFYGPNNLFGTNPTFASAAEPSAPSCSSYGSVPACMAAVIANFTPTNTAALGYGYQTPSSSSAYDPLFPLWLCNVNLPPGLVTMGCSQLHLTAEVS